MIDTFLSEWETRNKTFLQLVNTGGISNPDFFQTMITQLEVLKKAYPNDVTLVSQQAEFYHLESYLRKAGEGYRRVLEMDPLIPLTEKEKTLIKKFCPILMVTPKECFPLIDIVAVHHPEKPVIGYHLFWEDDYDFPDDYEPCDHEEVWIEYDPETEQLTNVMCWFHARVLESEQAVVEANQYGQRPVIRIEWGKHGSLLAGWETMTEPLTSVSISQWLMETYEHVSRGGRTPAHPLKRFWPKGFNGSYEEYLDFSVKVDPLEWMEKKPLIYKTKWVNAVIFTQSLLYNFHPKMEWPDRFFKSLPEKNNL